MFAKSDIELLLESQTWKTQITKRKPLIRSKLINKPIKLDPINQTQVIPHETLQHTNISITDRKKSILAIPLASFSAKLNSMVHDEDANYVKIPKFPKYPFGEHINMLGKVPKFELVPKETPINSDNVKNIKIESGRIKRTITSSLSASILKIKRKILKSRN